MNLSIQKLFFTLGAIAILFAFLILAKTILIPLGLALLLSFILYPLEKKFRSWGLNKILAALFSILTLFSLAAGAVYFFSTQIMGLTNELSDFREKIMVLFSDVILYLNNNISFVPKLERNDLLNQIQEWLKNSTGFLIKSTFSGTATILGQLLATIVYTFLILIYRKELTWAFLHFSPDDNKERMLVMFKNVQRVGHKYLSGMIVLILILGFANSIGLWIIGIDSPFLFGFMAATLSIIPYIGTTIGASIPVLYAFMSNDSLWIPLAVIILLWSIILVESNYLSPKIVGSSVKVNALAAILSLIIGASVWGVAGMILFLPFAAMLKVVCWEYEELRPLALLIGNRNEIGEEEDNQFLAGIIEKLKGLLPKFRFFRKK